MIRRGRETGSSLQPTEDGLQPAAAETVLLRLWGRATGSSLQPTSRTGAADSCRDTQLPAGHKGRVAGSCRDGVAETKGQKCTHCVKVAATGLAFTLAATYAGRPAQVHNAGVGGRGCAVEVRGTGDGGRGSGVGGRGSGVGVGDRGSGVAMQDMRMRMHDAQLAGTSTVLLVVLGRYVCISPAAAGQWPVP